MKKSKKKAKKLQVEEDIAKIWSITSSLKWTILLTTVLAIGLILLIVL